MKEINESKIEKLLAKLNTSKRVSKRDLLNTLGQVGLNEYLKLWEAEIVRRDGRRNIEVFSKEDIKKKVLNAALAKIKAKRDAYANSEEGKANTAKLKEMLAKLKKASY